MPKQDKGSGKKAKSVKAAGRTAARRRGITEDSPSWNAMTMGNRVGGAGPTPRGRGGVPGPAMSQDRTNTRGAAGRANARSRGGNAYGPGGRGTTASSRTIRPNRKRGRAS